MGLTSKAALPPILPRPPQLGANETMMLAALRQAVLELERGRRLLPGTKAHVSAIGDCWTFTLNFASKPTKGEPK